MRRRLPDFDRYDYYHRAVQSSDMDCEFVEKAYRESRGRMPSFLREDFCGTFANCCAWVKRGRNRRALGIDLDPEPIEYGESHYRTKLKAEQAERIELINGSVLTVQVPQVDVVVALNFSYYLFKSRMMLKRYFKKARAGLKKDGVFIVDCFGGPDCQRENVEITKFKSFKYYWDQRGFDPITNEAKFEIHFKRKGEKKRENVFSYDWRMWTIPEIKEVMLESGFEKVHVYWEGTTRSGEGDGNFVRKVQGEQDCDAWVAYLVAEA